MPEHLIHIPETDSATGQPKQNKNQRKCAWEKREKEKKRGKSKKKGSGRRRGSGRGGEQNKMKVTGLDERSGLVD